MGNIFCVNSRRGESSEGEQKSSSKLIDYSLKMSESIMHKETSIPCSHEFLNLKDESRLEKISLFTNSENITTIKDVLEHFSLSSESLAVVVSVGSSSTQFYSADHVLGACYIGTEALQEESGQGPALLRTVISAMEKQNLSIPLIMCNSIGYFVNRTLNLTSSTEEEIRAGVCNSELERAKVSGDESKISIEEKSYSDRLKLILLMSQYAQSDMSRNVPVIIMLQRKPKLQNNWLDVKAEEEAQAHTDGLYLVDFGGGGPALYFYDRSLKACILLAKDRTLRTNQEQFIEEMIAGTFETSINLKNIKLFLGENVVNHALENRINKYFLKITQTGKARQLHFLGHTLPSTTIIE